MSERLCASALKTLPASIAAPAYDRNEQQVGIVHFGIGAFHRAHQAWYTDAAMNAGERDWSILGVSLRSPGVAAQLNPQDGLYTLVECSAQGRSARVIGSVHEVLVAGVARARLAIALSAPQTRIVSFTVTEKGYCRKANGSLDFNAAARGFYPILSNALRERQASGCGGLTLLSCDNLADNGRQLARLMREWLAREAPDLVEWFEAECTCPSTMVDRIVPAPTSADRSEVAQLLGCLDEGAVVTEPFSQWVIEDRFARGRPAWEKFGAQLVADVASYETAKLRMLNGAHSALAYLGLQRGHTYVHEAMGDGAIRPLIECIMRDEAAPTVVAAPGQDLDTYADALLARFENPALNHKLVQIAMDGSQKIPQRWLETLEAQRLAGRKCPGLLTALAAWFLHLRGANGPVDDPIADTLSNLALSNSNLQLATLLFTGDGLLSGFWNPLGVDIPEDSRNGDA
ncbi:mannitol dehydrogenase family protein [Novosphingobium profundi]|uniref:mannitol dehydrogenase family protein n=1 Tax=Novosphingobium profundi TaxID=1774954 RepID=UPI001CFC8364|nr:mannitol dehydrogenase family protein [Novosphingobium profundi]